MRHLGLVILSLLCGPSIARSADDVTAGDRVALQRAFMVAGPQPYVHLPVVLTSVLPSTVSPDAEAWTVYNEDSSDNRIFIYTQSRVFRCARVEHHAEYQCVLKLASIIVHEAWHLKHGLDEVKAYEAQLAFLEFKQASGLLITEVRQSRTRAVAEKRKARQGPKPD